MVHNHMQLSLVPTSSHLSTGMWRYWDIHMGQKQITTVGRVTNYMEMTTSPVTMENGSERYQSANVSDQSKSTITKPL